MESFSFLESVTVYIRRDGPYGGIRLTRLPILHEFFRG